MERMVQVRQAALAAAAGAASMWAILRLASSRKGRTLLDFSPSAPQPADREDSTQPRDHQTRTDLHEKGHQEDSPDNQPERKMDVRTLLSALQSCSRVSSESISGPFQMNAGDEFPVVCFQFNMSHFACKAYLARGTQEEGSQHLKLQTIFEDNRRFLGEEQRYYVANEWNATKRYTRLKCGSGGAARNSVFTLEYDFLCPVEIPHHWGTVLLSQTLRMWYTSMVACVMHIVEPRDVPFATHDMITANTLSVLVQEQDGRLQGESCPICLEIFQAGDHVRRLPCMHTFHVVGADAGGSELNGHCNIDKHLTRDKKCPVCKTPIDIMERIEGTGKTPGSGVAAQPQDVADDRTIGSDVGDRGDTEQQTHRTTAVRPPPENTLAMIDLDAQTGADSAGLNDSTERGQDDGSDSSTRLPAQAAELERAVRSLQSRWLQIQDVVAGMQQMLQIIEDNHATFRTGTDAGDPNESLISDTVPLLEALASEVPIEEVPSVVIANEAATLGQGSAVAGDILEERRDHNEVSQSPALPAGDERHTTAEAAQSSCGPGRPWISQVVPEDASAEAQKLCVAYNLRQAGLADSKASQGEPTTAYSNNKS